MPQFEENIAEVLQADPGEHPRGGPELLQKWRRLKQQQGKLGRDSEEEFLEAAMSRAPEVEDEFIQEVPQDETMKERHADVCSEESVDICLM